MTEKHRAKLISRLELLRRKLDQIQRTTGNKTSMFRDLRGWVTVDDLDCIEYAKSQVRDFSYDDFEDSDGEQIDEYRDNFIATLQDCNYIWENLYDR